MFLETCCYNVLLFAAFATMACHCITGRRIVPEYFEVKPIQQTGSGENCPAGGTISSARDAISVEVQAIIRNQILPALQCDFGTCKDNPAQSCNEIYENNPSSVSGNYWLKRCDGAVVQVYCSMGNPCGCSGRTGGWKRVAFLNTTDASQPCPGGTRLFTESSPIRTCGRYVHGCVSLLYNNDFMEYQHVCGKMIGYQYRSPDAFASYNADTSKTIDDNYLDGVSITYGSGPRKHIWSFAVGLDETRVDTNRCPCANRGFTYNGVIPPFIDNNYFCATGSRTAVGTGFYSDDPVWDGMGCGQVSTCCTLNNPPWFCRTLPTASRENVEVRLCGDENNNNENIPISLIELYVQ